MFSTGYGAFSIRGRNRGAHRVSYEMHVGPISPRLVMDHLCRVTQCVNPAHLEPVTNKINMNRGMAPSHVAARNGTCGAGTHDMTDVYVRKGGGVQCRPCQLEKGRIKRAAAGAKPRKRSA